MANIIEEARRKRQERETKAKQATPTLAEQQTYWAAVNSAQESRKVAWIENRDNVQRSNIAFQIEVKKALIDSGIVVVFQKLAIDKQNEGFSDISLSLPTGNVDEFIPSTDADYSSRREVHKLEYEMASVSWMSGKMHDDWTRYTVMAVYHANGILEIIYGSEKDPEKETSYKLPRKEWSNERILSDALDKALKSPKVLMKNSISRSRNSYPGSGQLGSW